ncbi:ClpP-like prohead protease/major capsid protein fusion protein [Photobacterium leiognathi]|uniref:ClpP-like prohead protease/major capsid protein fusion protein n=1 Tax=Photobacterium leiognathi TaxID=553611 RepID=UPI0027388FD3|nr:ClpP-like prohead protease/major capsid protein fusion protein [Photobacterium leiognathi]
MAQQMGLIPPRASMPTALAQSNKWFSVNASLNGAPAEIYILDDIGSWGMTARQFSEALRAAGVYDAAETNLHLHSGGGDIFEGFAIYNLLSALPGKLNIYIEGFAASIASVIACVPNATVYIPSNAWFYLHEPWGAQGGEADDMRDYAEFLERNREKMVAAYSKKTGKSDAELLALMKKPGTWLDGAEAVAMGFANHVTEPLQAAASINANRLQEIENMPDPLKTLITPRAQVPTPPQTPPAVDPQAQFREQERNRRTAVAAIFDNVPGRFPEVLAQCLDDMDCTVDVAKDKLLAAMGQQSTPIVSTHAYAGNGNLIGDSVRNAIEARAGLAELESSNNYNGMRLDMLARASLTDRGVGVAGMALNDIVGMAFTHSTSDFGNILLNIANKAVLKGWEQAPETFEQWTQKGVLTDFRETKRVGLNTFGQLDKIGENGEYKYGTIGDRGENIMLASYGKMLSISRQMIINDDLQMLTKIPMIMGRAARATVGDLVYAVLTNNVKMADGKPLFHNDHRNMVPDSELDIASLSAGKTLMRTQKDKDRTLNIMPGFILSPVAMEDKLNQVIRSKSVAGAMGDIDNPLRNFAQVIAEPRLDNHDASMFYQVANNQFDGLEVAYLDGNDKPYIEQQQGFTVDGIATKVRIDAGVAPLDHRSFVRHQLKAAK